MIKFHYTYIIMALGYCVTGRFFDLVAITSLIIIHELGHFTLAKMLKFNVKKWSICKGPIRL